MRDRVSEFSRLCGRKGSHPQPLLPPSWSSRALLWTLQQTLPFLLSQGPRPAPTFVPRAGEVEGERGEGAAHS